MKKQPKRIKILRISLIAFGTNSIVTLEKKWFLWVGLLKSQNLFWSRIQGCRKLIWKSQTCSFSFSCWPGWSSFLQKHRRSCRVKPFSPCTFLKRLLSLLSALTHQSEHTRWSERILQEWCLRKAVLLHPSKTQYRQELHRLRIFARLYPSSRRELECRNKPYGKSFHWVAWLDTNWFLWIEPM